MRTAFEDELAYFLRRAEQEAIKAIVADQTARSLAHHELSRRYSAMAVGMLTNSGVPTGAR